MRVRGRHARASVECGYVDTLLNPLFPAFGPHFVGRGSRPVRAARPSRKAAEPSGRPMVLAARGADSASADGAVLIASTKRPPKRSRSGATLTSSSSRPARRPRTLDQRQSSALGASRARTWTDGQASVAARERGRSEKKADEPTARELPRRHDLALRFDRANLKRALRQIDANPRDIREIPDRLAQSTASLQMG